MSDTLTEPAAPALPTPAPRRRSWVKLVATALLLVVLVLLPVILGTQVAYLKLAQYVLIGAVGGIGLTLLVGQAGQLSLASPFFLLLGAVSYAVLAGDPRETPGLVALHWPPLLGVIGAVVICGSSGSRSPRSPVGCAGSTWAWPRCRWCSSGCGSASRSGY